MRGVKTAPHKKSNHHDWLKKLSPGRDADEISPGPNFDLCKEKKS